MTIQPINTPYQTLLDLITDDAYVAGFQTVGQYRAALLQQAAAPGALVGRIISAMPGMSIIEVKIDRGALPEWLDPGYQVHVSSTAPSTLGTPEAPRQLPPLPTPTARMYSQNGYRRASVSAGKGEPLFAADQMRDYARAAQLDGGQREEMKF